MSTKQYKVTLSDEAVTFLRAEDSRGRLSEGIDRLVHRIRNNLTTPTKSHHALRTLDLPDDEKPAVDPRNPTGDGRIAKGLATKDAAAAEKHANLCRGFKRICTDIFIGSIPEKHLPQYMERYIPDLTAADMWDIYNTTMADADGSAAKAKAEFWAESKRTQETQQAQAANYQLMLAMGHTPAEAMRTVMPPQTLRLSVKALKGMGMFGTPEAMTDAQIEETNAYWESHSSERANSTDDGDEVVYES